MSGANVNAESPQLVAGYFNGVSAALHFSFAILPHCKGFIKLSVEVWPPLVMFLNTSLLLSLPVYEMQYQCVSDTKPKKQPRPNDRVELQFIKNTGLLYGRHFNLGKKKGTRVTHNINDASSKLWQWVSQYAHNSRAAKCNLDIIYLINYISVFCYCGISKYM